MPNKHSFTYDELLKCGRGEMYDPDTPLLPLPDMLMMDRVVDVYKEGGHYGKGYVIAELDVRPDLWFFQCHFLNDPVMPGCLGLDALWQLLGFFLGWSGHKGKGRALGVREVKFFGQILPTSKTVSYRLDIRQVMALKVVVGVADGTVSVDGREIYSAKGLRAGIFSSLNGF